MPTVETVKGPVDVDQLGRTLMHEHVFVVSTEHMNNYGTGSWRDEETRVADAIAKLRSLKAKGIDTIVDPTVWGLGRYIQRIQRIAEQGRSRAGGWPSTCSRRRGSTSRRSSSGTPATATTSTT